MGHGLFGRLDSLVKDYCPANSYALITDTNVSQLMAGAALDILRSLGRVELFEFPPGEKNKTRETWSTLTDAMLAADFGRDCGIIALGGGVVGDVAGFVASTFMRGVPVVQVPTTLLAMIDSSIGGKTGVDTNFGKNLVGAFHQPAAVIADPDLLASLPTEQLRSGLAEAIKHGAIADRRYFDFLNEESAALLSLEPLTTTRLIERSVRIKAEVVAADETERGKRAILNFGHTIGHAVELLTEFRVSHGNAVSIGMWLEARVGEEIGATRRGIAEEH